MNSRASLALQASIILTSMALLIGCGSGSFYRTDTTPDSEAVASNPVNVTSSRGGEGFSDHQVAPMGLNIDWSYHHPGRIQQAFEANGNLYLVSSSKSNDHVLIKVSGESGLPQWTYPLQVPLDFAPSVYVYPEEIRNENPDELFIVERGMIHCIDDLYGARSYRIRCNFPVSTSVAPGIEYLVVGGYDMRIYGVSKKDRFVKWTYLTAGGITATPTNVAGRSYVSSEDGAVYCVKQGAGYSKGDSWTFKTLSSIETSPTVSADRVYVGSRDTKLYCLSDVGEESYLNWQASLGLPVLSSPVLAGNSIFVTLRDDRISDAPEQVLACLDIADGSEKWRQDGFSRIVSATSDEIWTTDTSGKLNSLDAEDGSPRWTLDCSGTVGVLMLSETVIAVVDGTGLVQCISKQR